MDLNMLPLPYIVIAFVLLERIDSVISSITNASTSGTTSVTTPSTTTTLSPTLELIHWETFYILAGTVLLGVPICLLIACLIRAIIAQGREKKITDEYDDDDTDFQHPAPAPPLPRMFRGNSIAGPFSNPAFDDDDDADDRRSDVVTPSFISTAVVDTDPEQPRRYKYIP